MCGTKCKAFRPEDLVTGESKLRKYPSLPKMLLTAQIFKGKLLVQLHAPMMKTCHSPSRVNVSLRAFLRSEAVCVVRMCLFLLMSSVVVRVPFAPPLL